MYNPEEKDIDLQREYLPDFFSLFSRYHVDPYGVPIRFFTAIAAQHRKTLFESGVQCKFLRFEPEKGIRPPIKIDIFYKEGSDCKPSPLFVFIHGFTLDMDRYQKETAVSMVGPLVKNGYRVAILDYIIYDPDHLKLVKEFISWIFQYADRTQTTDITLAGHGKGAHLLTYMLHNPDFIPECSRSKLKSLFLLCGIYDFREMALVVPSLLLTSGENIPTDYSSILWCWKGDSQKWSGLKIHVLTVEHTSVTLQEQSRQFSQVLEAAGFSSSFKQFDGLDHYTILLDQNVERNEITNYIKTAMQKASSGSSKGSNRPCTCASKR